MKRKPKLSEHIRERTKEWFRKAFFLIKECELDYSKLAIKFVKL